MNLPNKLTILRVIMIPFFLFFYFSKLVSGHYYIAFVLFVTASLTDTLDGQIARKRGLVTDFGKLMDPLADKLLVTAAMICILGQGYYSALGYALGLGGRDSGAGFNTIPLIILIIIVSRDLVVNSIRLVAAGAGTVIAADKWGKLKTICQMIWTSMALLGTALRESGVMDSAQGGVNVIFTAYQWIEALFYIAMIILTVISGFNYIWNNRTFMADA